MHTITPSDMKVKKITNFEKKPKAIAHRSRAENEKFKS